MPNKIIQCVTFLIILCSSATFAGGCDNKHIFFKNDSNDYVKVLSRDFDKGKTKGSTELDPGTFIPPGATYQDKVDSKSGQNARITATYQYRICRAKSDKNCDPNFDFKFTLSMKGTGITNNHGCDVTQSTVTNKNILNATGLAANYQSISGDKGVVLSGDDFNNYRDKLPKS